MAARRDFLTAKPGRGYERRLPRSAMPGLAESLAATVGIMPLQVLAADASVAAGTFTVRGEAYSSVWDGAVVGAYGTGTAEYVNLASDDGGYTYTLSGTLANAHLAGEVVVLMRGVGRMHVDWYGADASGVASSTTAIQAAVDAVYGEVLFSPGNYKTGGIGVQNRRQVRLIGAGEGVWNQPGAAINDDGGEATFITHTGTGVLVNIYNDLDEEADFLAAIQALPGAIEIAHMTLVGNEDTTWVIDLVRCTKGFDIHHIGIGVDWNALEGGGIRLFSSFIGTVTNVTATHGSRARTYIYQGTAQSGGADFIEFAAGITAETGELDGLEVTITSGTGSGQTRTIDEYIVDETTTPRSPIATVTVDWTTAPVGGSSVYSIDTYSTKSPLGDPTVADGWPGEGAIALLITNDLQSGGLDGKPINQVVITNFNSNFFGYGIKIGSALVSPQSVNLNSIVIIGGATQWSAYWNVYIGHWTQGVTLIGHHTENGGTAITVGNATATPGNGGGICANNGAGAVGIIGPKMFRDSQAEGAAALFIGKAANANHGGVKGLTLENADLTRVARTNSSYGIYIDAGVAIENVALRNVNLEAHTTGVGTAIYVASGVMRNLTLDGINYTYGETGNVFATELVDANGNAQRPLKRSILARAVTSNFTINAATLDLTMTNAGASGTVACRLISTGVAIGTEYTFIKTDNYAIAFRCFESGVSIIYGTTNTVVFGGTYAAVVSNNSGELGSLMTVRYLGSGVWACMARHGTWNVTA